MPYINLVNYDDLSKIEMSFKTKLRKSMPFYLNSHGNQQENSSELIATLERLINSGFTPIPVISPTTSAEFLQYLNDNKSKHPRILLHLKDKETRIDLPFVKALIKSTGYKIENCDLLVDLFLTDPKVNADIYKDYALKALKNLTTLPFNSTIFSASSFPEIIRNVKQDTVDSIVRLEWLVYKELIETYPELIYADYGNDDPFDIDSDHGFTIIPTIKYTCDDNWYIYRGHHDKKKPNDFTQFHELSRKLVNDTSVYQGKHYSWGDKIIYECAQITTCLPKCNHSHSLEWVKRTMNHHITYVVNQVSCLCAASSTTEHTR